MAIFLQSPVDLTKAISVFGLILKGALCFELSKSAQRSAPRLDRSRISTRPECTYSGNHADRPGDDHRRQP